MYEPQVPHYLDPREPPTAFMAARFGYGEDRTALIKRCRVERSRLYQGRGPAWHWEFEAWVGDRRVVECGFSLTETREFAACYAATIVHEWSHETWKRGPKGGLRRVS